MSMPDISSVPIPLHSLLGQFGIRHSYKWQISRKCVFDFFQQQHMDIFLISL